MLTSLRIGAISEPALVQQWWPLMVPEQMMRLMHLIDARGTMVV